MAEVDYGQKTIQISLRDRRQRAGLDTSFKLADESDLKSALNDAAIASREADASGFNAPSGSLPPPDTEGDIVRDPEARTYRVRWWAIPG